MRYGFVTCVQLGLSCMKKIYEENFHLNLVITLNDNMAKNKSGRVYLDKFCKEKGIDLIKCKNFNSNNILNKINEYNIDWLFIIGWSQIASEKLLSIPNCGALGIHPTLLPKGRGRAPIPWAIIKGLKKTGVTLFKLDRGIDTGMIGSQIEISISVNETSKTLYAKVNNAHKDLIKGVMPLLENKKLKFIKQDESQKTVWPKRKPEDGEIKNKNEIDKAYCLIRALTHPYPGAFIKIPEGKLIIWEAVKTNDEYKGKKIKFKDGILGLKKFEIFKKF